MKSKNFTVKQLKTVDEIVKAGQVLENGASVPENAERYLKEGSLIYIAEEVVDSKLKLNKLLDNRETKYLIRVTDDNSLMGSNYFSGHKVAPPSKEDAKEIVELMIKSKLIKEDETTKEYLSGTFKTWNI